MFANHAFASYAPRLERVTGSRLLPILALLAGLLPGSAGMARGEGPDYSGGTLKFLTLLTEGKFDDATAYFNPDMRNALSASNFGQLWKSLEERAGAYRSFGTPSVSAAGEYHKVEVPVTFEREIITVQVAWDKEGAVAGFHLVGEQPAPSGSQSPAPLPAPETSPAPAAAPNPARPQEPKPPFPYRCEEVSYSNQAIKLAGTLTIPEGKGPFPAALLITGSGSQDRNEEILGHKPFLVLADHLTRAGIAVLRVDDRGVGGSTGGDAHPTSADFASDVKAGLGFLRGRPEIDPKRIGLIGHSEGGVIAPMVASASDDVAFLVLLAGSGLPGDQIILRQVEVLAQKSGAGGDTLKKVVETERKCLDLIKAGADSTQLLTYLLRVAGEQMGDTSAVAAMPESERKAVVASLEGEVHRAASPWFRYFISYDPRPALEKVRVPVLALGGALDTQVDPDRNLPEIQKALAAGGNQDVTVRRMPGLNHLFQKAQTGAPSEYRSIEETFNPAALDTIRTWISKRFVRS